MRPNNYIFTIFSISLCSCILPAKKELKNQPKQQLTQEANLPPDPGTEGEQTLFGIDVDKDGLRDDVQRWIRFSYPNQPLIRKALGQYAVDKIETFKYVNNKEKSIRASYKVVYSVKCISHIQELMNFKKKNRKIINYRKIHKIIENTKERYKVARRVDDNFSGQGYSLHLEKLSSCRFQISHPLKEEYLKKYKGWYLKPWKFKPQERQ